MDTEITVPAATTIEFSAAAEAARWRIVATKCCFCRRALVDNESVRDGIGPVCARKHGYSKCDREADFVTAAREATKAGCLDQIAALLDKQNARAAANVVVYLISASITSTEDDPKNMARIDTIRALGFEKMALALEERLYGEEGFYARGSIELTTLTPGWVKITCKGLSREGFGAYLSAVRAQGGFWSARDRANHLPLRAVAGFLAAVRASLPGTKVLNRTAAVAA